MAERPVVLITGASSGLGLALTKRLLQGAYRVVATARESSLDRFESAGIMPSDNCLILALDVESEYERNHAVHSVLKHWHQVDVLVNNAGICYRSVWEDMDHPSLTHLMEVNFFGPIFLSQLLMGHWRSRGYGRLINISSVGGMMAMPTMGAYNASKFAIEGATESLWYELKPWGIKVSLVEPGFVHSASFQNTPFTTASRHSLNSKNSPYHMAYREMIAFIEKMMKKSWVTPESIAKRIEKLIRMKNPPLRFAVTPDARLFGLMRRFLPSRIYHAMLYHSLPNVKKWGKP